MVSSRLSSGNVPPERDDSGGNSCWPGSLVGAQGPGADDVGSLSACLKCSTPPASSILLSWFLAAALYLHFWLGLTFHFFFRRKKCS